MGSKSRNLSRAYLACKLRERGLSRRKALRTLNQIFMEMSKALQRGQAVEFPFGRLVRVKQVSKRWQLMDDEPLQPYTLEHELDEEGERQLREIYCKNSDFRCSGTVGSSILAFVTHMYRVPKNALR